MESSVRFVSRCRIKPEEEIAEKKTTNKSYSYLTPWDLTLLSSHYIQEGLLFLTPSPSSLSSSFLYHQNNPMLDIIQQLKQSLSSALSHFFPLSGRLATTYKHEDNPPSYSVSLDCANSHGVEFIHAFADVAVKDILSSHYVPQMVKLFFPLDEFINHDGHTDPLCAVQITELVDGFFIGCSFNHVVGDGTSFWHFFNTWAEICRANGGSKCISRPPILGRWFPKDHQDYPIRIPVSRHYESTKRYKLLLTMDKIFHFSAQSIAQLKARANEENDTTNISSFQALSALIWRSITRARRLNGEEETICKLVINDRMRLAPPLSSDHFGCYIDAVAGKTKAGQLLNHSLGWAARILHEAVASRNDQKVREDLKEWIENPSIFQMGPAYGHSVIAIGGSPRFDSYGCDFGWGKALAVRSGSAYKFCGNVNSYPACEGGGSVDVEICLSPTIMFRLESDEEFVSATSNSAPF